MQIYILYFIVKDVNRRIKIDTYLYAKQKPLSIILITKTIFLNIKINTSNSYRTQEKYV